MINSGLIIKCLDQLINNIFLLNDKYIFLAPRLSNEHVMCSNRSEEMSQEG